MVVIPHIFAGGETDTYTWSQQGSPEICFCTGGNRVFSQGICDLKASPDRRGCPVPCLRGNGMRQTQSGVWELKRGLQDKAVTQYTAGKLHRLWSTSNKETACCVHLIKDNKGIAPLSWIMTKNSTMCPQTAMFITEQHAYCACHVCTTAGVLEPQRQTDSTYVKRAGLPGVTWWRWKSITTLFLAWL